MEALDGREVGQIHWNAETGAYTLEAEFAGVANQWRVWVEARQDWSKFEDWAVIDPREQLGISLSGGSKTVAVGAVPERGIGILIDEGTVAM
ncbi:hypothetical protein ABK046_45195, partial [Streptomyces caeruleatus]